jgi:GINS complex subunit 3
MKDNNINYHPIARTEEVHYISRVSWEGSLAQSRAMGRHLDIDRILSEGERVPCTFNNDSPLLGQLDTTNEEEYLPEGTKVELPLWLAKALSHKDYVKIELPKHYGSKMRDAILAGAAPINLKDFSHYYFEIGLQLATLLDDEDLRRTMKDAFTGDRFKNLLLYSLTK